MIIKRISFQSMCTIVSLNLFVWRFGFLAVQNSFDWNPPYQALPSFVCFLLDFLTCSCRKWLVKVWDTATHCSENTLKSFKITSLHATIQQCRGQRMFKKYRWGEMSQADSVVVMWRYSLLLFAFWCASLIVIGFTSVLFSPTDGSYWWYWSRQIVFIITICWSKV